MEVKSFETVEVVQRDAAVPFFHHLYLNRPAQRNAFTPAFFAELPRALSLLDQNPAARRPHFCAGIDTSSLGSLDEDPGREGLDATRARERLRRHILSMQDAASAVERCRKPVIATVHGTCICGGIDLIAACGVRYCTADTFVSVKEVDPALAADRETRGGGAPNGSYPQT